MKINVNFHRHGLLASCCALGALVFSTLAYGFWQWHSDWLLAHQEITSAPTIIATDESASMITGLPDDHLFGAALSKVGQVPITNLQLRVTGLVKIENEGGSLLSKAYISISGQPSKIYRVGDGLPYGVKIYAVTNDAVILENNGRLEKLPLPREPLQFKAKELKESA